MSGIEHGALRNEIHAAVTDYQRSFPPPFRLAPNLELALRALVALDRAGERVSSARARRFTAERNALAAEHRAERAESERAEWQLLFTECHPRHLDAAMRLQAVREQFTEPWAPSPDGDVVLVSTLRHILDDESVTTNAP